MRWLRFLCIFPWAFASAAEDVATQASQLLEAKCVTCHSATPMAGLDLRSRDAALKGGGRGPAIVPGAPEKSLLLAAVNGKSGLKMPMGRPALSGEEIDILARWVKAGARWKSAPRNSENVWWSFRRPVKPALPAGAARHPIDAFLSARHEEVGLKPLAEADRRTLARRLYLDLHGLPPSPEDIKTFVDDQAPDAYVRLVDRLLASPRYGERWARQWLDVVRYADTGGFETDIYFPNAWRYRDYVIKSLNDDKPYDQFVREQVAGDELYPDDLDLDGNFDIPAEKQKHLEAKIGTGMFTVGPVYHEAALFGEQQKYEWLTDAVDTAGSAFLGLTVGCARCHDHKFDPVGRSDYHRMMALFSASEPREVPATHKMSLYGFYAGYTRLVRVEQLKEAIDAIERGVRQRVTEEIKGQFPPEVMGAYDKPAKQRTAEERALAARVEDTLTKAGLKENAAGKPFQPPYTPEERDRRERLIYELGQAALKARFSYPQATVLGRADRPQPVHLTSRGDWRQKGEVVAPGVPEVFGAAKVEGRKEFAEWLTSRRNPLTARVIVNRIWLGHFGKGLVTTPNDFGKQGEAPTHPELLDWLAVEFMERGWSAKAMHRLIVTSEAYRRSSAFQEANAKADPQNKWYWRFDRQRLQAEAVRDSVLAVSGELNLKEGGPSVFPPLTADERLGMWEASQWPESLDEREHTRRSIYLYAKRSFPYPLFTTFDTPDSSVSCGRRDVTTVAPQALALLNSDFMKKAAEKLAARVAKDASGEDSIQRAWSLVLGRGPSDQERAKAAALWKNTGKLSYVCLALLNTNEFLYVD